MDSVETETETQKPQQFRNYLKEILRNLNSSEITYMRFYTPQQFDHEWKACMETSGGSKPQQNTSSDRHLSR